MMADLEEVIKGLECCKNKTCDYARPDVVCPYVEWSGEYETSCYECTKRLADDVLSMLKAQEPKPPIVKENAYGWKFFYCPSCGREFNANRKHGCVNAENFCDKCGQAVKWDG